MHPKAKLSAYLVALSALYANGASAFGPATEYNVWCPPGGAFEINGSCSPSGSLLGAAVMGVKGFGDGRGLSCNYVPPANWETTLRAKCQMLSGVNTLWPDQCTVSALLGSAGAIKTIAPSQNWVQRVYAGDGQKEVALNQMVFDMLECGTPIVLPIYGQADNWVTMTKLNVSYQSPNIYKINSVIFYNGGTGGCFDSSGDSYDDGPVARSGNNFKNTYFLMLDHINPSCDPPAAGCVSDFYYNKFVYLAEPPGAMVGYISTSKTVFAVPAGIVEHGEQMSETIAQQGVWTALYNSGLDAMPEIWSRIQYSEAGPAQHVRGMLPEGKSWDYYVVPLLRGQLVVGFATLSGSDGAYEQVATLREPRAFAPVTAAQAAQLVRAALRPGEQVTYEGLHWDVTARPQLSRDAHRPYHQFQVVDAKGRPGGKVVLPWLGAAPPTRVAFLQ